jgi:hypothetical protein
VSGLIAGVHGAPQRIVDQSFAGAGDAPGGNRTVGVGFTTDEKSAAAP